MTWNGWDTAKIHSHIIGGNGGGWVKVGIKANSAKPIELKLDWAGLSLAKPHQQQQQQHHHHQQQQQQPQ